MSRVRMSAWSLVAAAACWGIATAISKRAVAAAALLLDERLVGRQWLGAILVIGAVRVLALAQSGRDGQPPGRADRMKPGRPTGRDTNQLVPVTPDDAASHRTQISSPIGRRRRPR